MKAKLLNIDEICKDLPPVVTNKPYGPKKSFHEGGLFSQKIFGPVRNYSCACGNYYGRSMSGKKCEVCDVEIVLSSERRKRFAKIELPFPVMNPTFYYLLEKVGKTTLKDILKDLALVDNVQGYYYNEKLKKFIKVKEDEKVPPNVKLYSGLNGALELVTFIANQRKDKNSDWNYILENLDKFFIRNILVLPPEFRPASKTRDSQKRDQLNDFLMYVLNFSLTKSSEVTDTDKDPRISSVSIRNLQKLVFGYYDYVYGKLSKKQGIIRDTILGKRTDFSGRAVIAPDPTLKLDECSVPYLMLLELYKLELANILLEKRKEKRYDRAITRIDECIKVEDESLYDLVEQVCEGRHVILNRQPTLHRMGILAFKVKPNRTTVIQIHPMVCDPYNADFDGDQMAVYRALYPPAENECAEKLLISKNLLSPSTGELITGINQDVVLGLYLLTLNQTDSDSVVVDKKGIVVKGIKVREGKMVNGDGNEVKDSGLTITTKGRIQFLKCLPPEYIRLVSTPKLNRPIDRNALKRILNDIARTHPPEIVQKTLDDIKKLGFTSTTEYGSTMSLKGMKLKDSDKIVSGVLDDKSLNISQQVNKLKSPQINKKVRDSFAYSIFIDSGSRGTWDQARQIILCRGYVSNSRGEVVPTPIRNNFVQGFTREEYFTSSYGTRKGLLDTALNTGMSGYLTRKIVYAVANLEYDKNNLDCGTTDVFPLHVNKKTSAKSLIGRFHICDVLDEFGNVVYDKDGKKKTEIKEITYTNYELIKDTHIRLRSPIFCKTHNLCRTCYGSHADVVDSRYVGLVAGQSLGEIGTQLVMRTFHTSGVAQMSDKAESSSIQQEDIVTDLSNVRAMLHNNRKYKYDNLIKDLYEIYGRHRNILMVHFECLVSQLMRSGNQRWRTSEAGKGGNTQTVEMVSILSVPHRESWLLAVAFHKPKEHLLEGVLRHSGKQLGLLEKIMLNYPL